MTGQNTLDETLSGLEDSIAELVTTTVAGEDFYLQLFAILVTALCSWIISRYLKRRIEKFAGDSDPQDQHAIKNRVGSASYHFRDLIFPLTNALLLGIAVAVSREFFNQQWLVQFVQGMNLLSVVYFAAIKISNSQTVRYFSLLVLMPLIVLYAIGLLDDLVEITDGISVSLGNIHFTIYAIGRTIIFGAVLFWVGRLSNQRGVDFIRRRKSLTETAKELFLKSFQIGLFVLITLVILQIAGIDLTAFVVFGGAIGVGLGFGLQQIASNFISGIIILLDRSIAIGDYIELEDGRAGTLRELTMRSATLETYDGKDIMVPNERFITTAFTNWTHNHQKQRYPIVFEVAYGTDLEKLFDILRTVVASHPRVMSGDDLPIEERPDAEIQAFNDSGIEILVEFWMEGVDDGKNRVGGDLLFMIYQALQENEIVIPFPQREIVIKEDHSKKP